MATESDDELLAEVTALLEQEVDGGGSIEQTDGRAELIFLLDAQIDAILDHITGQLPASKEPFQSLVKSGQELQEKCRRLSLELAVKSDSNRRIYDALYRLTLKFRELKTRARASETELQNALNETERLRQQVRVLAQVQTENEILAQAVRDKEDVEKQLLEIQDARLASEQAAQDRIAQLELRIQEAEQRYTMLEKKHHTLEQSHQILQKSHKELQEEHTELQSAATQAVLRHTQRETQLLAEVLRHIRSASDDLYARQNYRFGQKSSTVSRSSSFINRDDNTPETDTYIYLLGRLMSRKQVSLPGAIAENPVPQLAPVASSIPMRIPKSASFSYPDSSGILRLPTSVSSNSVYRRVITQDGFDTEDDDADADDEPDSSPRWVSRPKIDVDSRTHRRTRSLMTPVAYNGKKNGVGRI